MSYILKHISLKKKSTVGSGILLNYSEMKGFILRLVRGLDAESWNPHEQPQHYDSIQTKLKQAIEDCSHRNIIGKNK